MEIFVFLTVFHYGADLTDEMLKVNGLFIDQEVWAEVWGCPSALPWQDQGSGACQGPVEAPRPDQVTQAWVALAQWVDP